MCRLIDADALIKDIKNAEIPHGNIVGVVLAYIKTQPTIEAVPVVHGNLIKRSPYTSKCSVCGHVTTECDANYCPNCGIRFDVEYFGLCMDDDDLK